MLKRREELLEKAAHTPTKVPQMSVRVLYTIGLALESGCDEKQMRETWGDQTIDWLNEAMESPEYKEFGKEFDATF